MFNKWIGMGRITKDIDLQTGKTGSEYCKFTVAIDREKDKNGDKKTDFVDCTAFGKTAAFVQKYFKKGDGIIVLGRFESDKYTGKDGMTRTNWSVNVREVYFPASKGKSEQTNSDVANFQNIDPSDIPF